MNPVPKIFLGVDPDLELDFQCPDIAVWVGRETLGSGEHRRDKEKNYCSC
ncbi:MAG: hypothetical protein JSW50_12445 [Candidatus Latescibacterota bacterium]|nr:MAG: hypothetical protein JSW50_12445 [Candidatus Latescibacterota bacterium]